MESGISKVQMVLSRGVVGSNVCLQVQRARKGWGISGRRLSQQFRLHKMVTELAKDGGGEVGIFNLGIG